MKSGFTLIELLVAIFVSSLISTVVYNSFVLTNRMVSTAGTIVDTDVALATVHNQFEQDLSGTFVPYTDAVSTQTPVADKEKKADDAKKKAAAQKKNEAVTIRSVFYSTNKSNNLSTLSFITSNPMAVYTEAKNAFEKPRIVRIMYRIKSDDKVPDQFKIERQESTDLDIKAFEQSGQKSIRAYTLADGIKSIKVEYHYPLRQTEDKNKKEEKPVFKKATQWQPDNWTAAERKQLPPMPQFVFFTIIFSNDEQYNLRYELPCFTSSINPPKTPQTKQQPKKDDQKNKQADSKGKSKTLEDLAKKINFAFTNKNPRKVANAPKA